MELRRWCTPPERATLHARGPRSKGGIGGAEQGLKKRGFTLVGPTIMYAWMQAVELVNDHHTGCPRYAAVLKLGSAANLATGQGLIVS